jgi:hypothetical protein
MGRTAGCSPTRLGPVRAACPPLVSSDLGRMARRRLPSDVPDRSTWALFNATEDPFGAHLGVWMPRTKSSTFARKSGTDSMANGGARSARQLSDDRRVQTGPRVRASTADGPSSLLGCSAPVAILLARCGATNGTGPSARLIGIWISKTCFAGSSTLMSRT